MEKAERWEHLKANGEIFQVLTYGREVSIEGRNAILAIVQDRSKLNAAQTQVLATQTLLDSIVDNLPVGVFVKDMAENGRYVRFNAACANITGLSPDAVLASDDTQLFSASQARHFQSLDRQALQMAGTLHVEEQLERASGDHRTVRSLRRVLPSTDGENPRYVIGIVHDVTEERAVEAKLERLAMHDVLTGLPNRASFMEHIRLRLAEAETRGAFALLYIDVDHFKHVNDSMGHPAGDALLRALAFCLLELKGPGDFVARLGGDEFAVLLDLDPSCERPGIFADALFQILQKPFELDGINEYVSCSIGVALGPQDGASVDVLMRSADLALYAAKDAGRSTCRCYATEMRIAAEHRHLTAMELREAVAGNQLELYYQPILRLDSGLLTGFEALVRWRHPTKGMISPADFIPIAEENGQIIQIGEWVLREACSTAALWPRDIKIAVNLSVCQFRDAALMTTMVNVLSETGLEPGRLEIEITESVFLADNIQGIPLLKAMKALGIRIAIDDFGTGYSSLSYLRSFPFDKIKLDKSFVSAIETDVGDLAIVRAVAGIARGFNATTLAEGVETEAQFRQLRAEGFDEVQGFLLGRPMPRHEAEAMIHPIERRVTADSQRRREPARAPCVHSNA